LAWGYGADVWVEENVKDISTSQVRSLLLGDENGSLGVAPRLTQAADMLGFPFFVMGEVTRGRQLGRELGFPTLNLYPDGDKFLPRFGVYKTRTCLDGCFYEGITNIGLRPTVNADEVLPTVETHLFDYNGDAYGKEIRVEFLHFVRGEMKFASLDELKMRIASDVVQVKSIL
jgi:riboflavin kinase/FMN adenylyltransferase